MTQDWIRESVERVTRQYSQSNPFVTQDPEVLFDGPMPSHRNPEVEYHVIVRSNGAGTCTCPGFTQYHRGQDCSHITLVKESLA